MRILVLAGGYDQITFIKYLKKEGNYVILVDYFNNPPAKEVADMHYQVSTLDEKAVFELAQKEQVDYIFTACTDQALMTVASVSEKLGLPTYLSSEKTLNVTNKNFMKKIFIENAIPTAWGYIYQNYSDIDYSAFRELYPLVVKPCDCNSSKGVTKVCSEEELKEAVRLAFELSRSNQIIIEEFMEGIELSIDLWVDNEDVKVLSVTETIKRDVSDMDFTICGSVYPAAITANDKKVIYNIAKKIVRGFGLTNCPILIQAIKTENEIKVIEFSARMGGGTKYKLIEYVSGIDIMDIYTRMVLGEKEQIIKPLESDEFIEMIYLYAQNGIFSELFRFEECKNSQIIKDYFIYKTTGAEIKQARTSSDRIAGVIIVADSQEKLQKKKNEFFKKADILDKSGKKIMIKDSAGEC